ncbi:hypothetical protein V1519DRAFT_480038 [Lipomyces tetrasporus]
MSYLEEQWLHSLEGEMKMCWHEQYIEHNVNFGYSTTSAVEASHHALKSGMLSAPATLHSSALRLLEHDSWSQKLKDISKSRESFRIPLSIHRTIELRHLLTRVSVAALRIIEKEICKLAEGSGLDTTCNCAAKQRFLLPCRHEIALGCPILLGTIHVRWRIDLPSTTDDLCSEELEALFDPPRDAPRKGRPRKS